MKLGLSRGMDTKRPRGSDRSKPCHESQLTRRSLPPYPWPPEQAQPGVSKPCRTTRRRPRGASRHRFLDDFLQFSTPSPSDEQPDADGGVARRHGQNRGGGEGCGYAASLGQRKRVAHIPTAETEAARSSLILEGQGQARSHLKFNPSWSYEWGPVQRRRGTLDFEASTVVGIDD